MNSRNKSFTRGQSLVAFALALPILILLSVMVFDLGRAVYYSSAIHNAAREGVRKGSVQMDVANSWSNMKDRAIEYAIGLGLEETDITFAGWGPDEPNGTHTVQLTIEYTFAPATPLVSNFLPGGVITLVGDAKMRTEYDKPNN
jgi:Flp pilus assembly protein TadG